MAIRKSAFIPFMASVTRARRRLDLLGFVGQQHGEAYRAEVTVIVAQGLVGVSTQSASRSLA